ncbi:hypothetical protein PUR_47100 [Paenibacillus sp. URB8-2]|nr:hypothetical protein PUR_47100 [Paenibacillus sp. URB8-2]
MTESCKAGEVRAGDSQDINAIHWEFTFKQAGKNIHRAERVGKGDVSQNGFSCPRFTRSEAMENRSVFR